MLRKVFIAPWIKISFQGSREGSETNISNELASPMENTSDMYAYRNIFFISFFTI